MPLKRTPPPASPSITPTATASKNVDRESHLKTASEQRCDFTNISTSPMMNVTMRKKDSSKNVDDDALYHDDTNINTQVK